MRKKPVSLAITRPAAILEEALGALRIYFVGWLGMFLRKRKYHHFLLACFVLLYACALGMQSQESPQASHDTLMSNVLKKYSKFLDYQPDESMQKWLMQADQISEKYTDDVYLDHLMNAEAYRQQGQLEFNNRILRQLKIPLGDQSFSIALRNSDIGKMLFVACDWTSEWYLYRRMLDSWAAYVAQYLVQHRKESADNLRVLQGALKDGDELAVNAATKKIFHQVASISSKDVIKYMTQELMPVFVSYLCVTHLFDAIKRHYLLDRSHATSILTLLSSAVLGSTKGAEPEAVSLFDLIEAHWIAGMPLRIIKTGVLDQVNDSLQRFGLLPAWSSSFCYLFSKRIAFMFLFMRWSTQSFLQPLLLEAVINNRQELLEQLELPADKQPTATIKHIVSGGYGTVFPLWLGLKAEKYSSWQTMLNAVIMLPAVVKLVRKFYPIVQQFFTKKEAAAQTVAVVNQGGVT